MKSSLVLLSLLWLQPAVADKVLKHASLEQDSMLPFSAFMDAELLKADYDKDDPQGLTITVNLLRQSGGAKRVMDAFAALKNKFGIGAKAVRKAMKLPSRPHTKTNGNSIVMDKSVATTEQKSSVEGQNHLDATLPEKSLKVASSKTSAGANSLQEASKSSLAEFDATILEGDIIGVDLAAAKGAIQMILGLGGRQRLHAAFEALGNKGYDAKSMESWLAGKSGPPVMHFEASPPVEQHQVLPPFDKQTSAEKQAVTLVKHIEETAGRQVYSKALKTEMQKAPIHPWGHLETKDEQTEDAVNMIAAYVDRHDKLALKQARQKLLESNEGKQRLTLAILKLQEKGYSQDTLAKEFDDPPKKEAVATARKILLQLSDSVTRKSLRSSNEQFLSSES